MKTLIIKVQKPGNFIYIPRKYAKSILIISPVKKVKHD